MQNYIELYENKTVAVTGASGYLASALIDALKETPVRILRVSRRDLLPISGMKSLKADIYSKDCWSEIVNQADIIFHLAGNTSVYTAVKNPADSLNSTVLPLTCLVAAAQEAGCIPRVVFASTATVYGLTNNLPVSEDTQTDPITNYDLHKLFAENQLKLASNQGILQGVSFRLANVYGWSPSTSSADDRGILNKITRLALQGVGFSLYGDGNYIRDYIYIDDVVRAFMIGGVANGLGGRSFNVASGKGITVHDAFHLVAERVEKFTGKSVSIHNVPWPKNADPIELRSFVADTTSFYNAAGWQSNICLEDGIDLMISQFSKLGGIA